MRGARSQPLRLSPAANVVAEKDGYRATSSEPWLKIEPVEAFRPGRIVRVVYSAGLLDGVTRPLLRFHGSDGQDRDAIMPAPSEGAGIWRGRVPPETVAVSISPTCCEGPFSFAIESVRSLRLVEHAASRAARPKRGFFAASARMVGLRDEADLNLRWVLGRSETQDFRAWKRLRARPAPAKAGTDGPPVVVFLDGANATSAELAASCHSLCAQTYRNWRVDIRDASPEAQTHLAEIGDARFVFSRATAGFEPAPDSLAAFFVAGDEIAPHGLAAFVSLFARKPNLAVAYCDEVRLSAGARPAPIFKPDWSPTRQQFAPYVGRTALMRCCDPALLAEIRQLSPERAVDRILHATPIDGVGHIRRPSISVRRPAATIPFAAPAAPEGQGGASVLIVIPTKDRIDLLRPCIESVLAQTAWRDYRIVVVDNGSVETGTHEALARLQAQDARLLVAPDPRPFNFSALCNFGAARLASDFLLFLNNDTVVLQPLWIENLLSFAAQPDIGAVGAQLLYPDRRVQHAGIVLGMGGVAGHFGEGAPAGAPGWLGGASSPHEASAVTAACLMVERRKFEAVGGFDADNLPVDLNDVDLCLRLSARGWRTICDGRTQLLHYQSASRGGGLRLQRVYEKERSYFLRHWRDRIRDDPYFNPNMSLYDYEPLLG